MIRRNSFQWTSLCLGTMLFASAGMASQHSESHYGDGLIMLDQGWDEASRDRFYHAPQGSPIMPYSWFMVLEQPDSTDLFRDDLYLRHFGMITSGKKTDRNPDALPIGLTRDFGIHGIEPKLGMNCGACHVSEVSHQGRMVLIDGGASHFNFWAFMTELEKALQQTFDDEEKFARFVSAVLGPDASDSRRQELHARLRGVLEVRQDWAIRNATHLEPGPGRVDALNVILNQVTAQMLDRPDNARPSDAPVSYPFVWDAPYLDYVQYNAVVPNAGAGAMGRNVGQVLGVFGEVSIIPSTIPPGYASSVNMDHLIELEKTMETLTSPSWREMAEKGILPALDEDKVSLGKEVYAANCVTCHQVIDPVNRGALASIHVTKVALSDVGTDPVATLDFGGREIATGPLQGRKTDFLEGQPLCERTHADQILAHVTVGTMMHDLNHTGAPIAKTIGGELLSSFKGALSSMKDAFSLKPHGSHQTEESDQALIERMAAQGASQEEIVKALEDRSEDKSALFQLLVDDGLNRNGPDRGCLEVLEHAVYRARPLNGVWATGPFLHNGSVPTLWDMLLPPDQRPESFHVGSRELDPVNVGFVSQEGPRTMHFDTTIAGNTNVGHVFGADLSDEEKEALLEYLKSL
ncbi:di-heme-cytochrome C peroxidase [Nitrincola sp. MINF-07-Sa-05]|uniref:di-heme-cytochrome C peroxidase n=1 Tax=Nitrincola salilacus TaxID=3400273 RepID=UPI0039185582